MLNSTHLTKPFNRIIETGEGKKYEVPMIKKVYGIKYSGDTETVAINAILRSGDGLIIKQQNVYGLTLKSGLVYKINMYVFTTSEEYTAHVQNKNGTLKTFTARAINGTLVLNSTETLKSNFKFAMAINNNGYIYYINQLFNNIYGILIDSIECPINYTVLSDSKPSGLKIAMEEQDNQYSFISNPTPGQYKPYTMAEDTSNFSVRYCEYMGHKFIMSYSTNTGIRLWLNTEEYIQLISATGSSRQTLPTLGPNIICWSGNSGKTVYIKYVELYNNIDFTSVTPTNVDICTHSNNYTLPNGIEYFEDKNIFIFADCAWFNNNPVGIRYSTDGKTWTLSNITAGPFIHLRYSGGKFFYGTLCGTLNDIDSLYVSDDGKSWSKISTFNSSYTAPVVYVNGYYLTGPDTGGSIATYYSYSTNGTSWTKTSHKTNFLGAIYDSTHSKYIIALGTGLYNGSSVSSITQRVAVSLDSYVTFYQHGSAIIAICGDTKYVTRDGGTTWSTEENECIMSNLAEYNGYLYGIDSDGTLHWFYTPGDQFTAVMTYARNLIATNVFYDYTTSKGLPILNNTLVCGQNLNDKYQLTKIYLEDIFSK